MLKHKRVLFVGFLLLVLATAAVAQELKIVPLVRSDRTSGAQMYKDYCAVCHGAEGRSDGPAVAFLNAPPPELSTLAQRNNGQYPANRVSFLLRAGSGYQGHGQLGMPDWATLFHTSKGVEGYVRVYNLTNFVGSLQQPKSE